MYKYIVNVYIINIHNFKKCNLILLIIKIIITDMIYIIFTFHIIYKGLIVLLNYIYLLYMQSILLKYK